MKVLKFVETDTTTNLLTQAEYAADLQRDIGNQPGIARSKLVNKAMRQASLIAAGIAEYVAGKQAVDVTDELTPAQFAVMLTDALDAEFVKLSGATMSGALALFGGDTGVTPAQFDNDTSIATTAFVQRALGNYAGTVGVSAAATLNAATHVGKLIALGGSVDFTVTLPLLSAVVDGATIAFQAIDTAKVTIARQGADTIQVGIGTVTAISPIRGGDSVVFVADKVNNVWRGLGQFSNSLTTNGYQKLPSGLIMQWGNSAVNPTTSLAILFPITFPTACLNVTLGDNKSTGIESMGFFGQTTTGLTLRNEAGSARSANYLAIGY